MEELVIRSSTGISLKAWYSRVQNPKAVAVIMHGVGSNRASMLERMRLANKLKLNALAFDFQGHGESGGEEITFGYLESFDAQAAVLYARRQEPKLPIFIIGVSLGGAAALLADPPLEVDGMILEAVYPDISSAIRNRISMHIPFGELLTPLLTLQIEPRLGIKLSQLSPSTFAKDVTTPVLVLSGSADLHTTKQDTQMLFESFKADSSLVFFDGAAHVDLQQYDSAAYEVLVQNFIELHL